MTAMINKKGTKMKIKQTLSKFADYTLLTYKKADGNRTSVRLPKALVDAAKEYSIKNGITVQCLASLLESNRPDDVPQSEAIRRMFDEIYYKGDEVALND